MNSVPISNEPILPDGHLLVDNARNISLELVRLGPQNQPQTRVKENHLEIYRYVSFVINFFIEMSIVRLVKNQDGLIIMLGKSFVYSSCTQWY